MIKIFLSEKTQVMLKFTNLLLTLICMGPGELSTSRWNCPIQKFLPLMFINPNTSNFYEPGEMSSIMSKMKY